MKLTIEHLSNYLPYNLQIQIELPIGNEIGILKAVGFHPYTGKEERITIFINTDKENGRQIILKKDTTKSIIKPLLIPLRELTKQQVIDIFTAGFLNAGHTDWPVYNIDIEWHDLAVELFYKKASFSFDFKNCQFETQPFAFNQKKAFEKIYELHADINGLIEAGLAINKNHTQS